MTSSNGTDRVERVRELQRQLESQVAELVSGDGWARMLETAARFHRYSANNVMLILCQRPYASRVAGYQTWRSLGRQVRKGEHGIQILAPCKYKFEDEDGNEHMAIRGFTTATVFDISQTDGDEIADVRPEMLSGEAPIGLWAGLAKQVAEAGFMLARGDCGGANGVTRYDSRTVTVRADVDDAQACKTLCHELGHIFLDHEHDIRSLGCRGRLEVEAESVAYIVSHAMGLASNTYSLPYVAHWANGDAAVIRQTAERVVRVAGAILDALSASESREVAA
jgi:antirestriction protein ArdC